MKFLFALVSLLAMAFLIDAVPNPKPVGFEHDYSTKYAKYIIKHFCQYAKDPNAKRFKLAQEVVDHVPGPFGPDEPLDPTEEVLDEICRKWEETGRSWNPETMYDIDG
ncbi:unnamed protein product [Bursaphelenchus xylophilus]|nr:unnamed protein product [Bursaphelenchus xylophilus]CAG9106114.1 unnamed protein product [Bursaphelenchus xylophilus]